MLLFRSLTMAWAKVRVLAVMALFRAVWRTSPCTANVRRNRAPTRLRHKRPASRNSPRDRPQPPSRAPYTAAARGDALAASARPTPRAPKRTPLRHPPAALARPRSARLPSDRRFARALLVPPLASGARRPTAKRPSRAALAPPLHRGRQTLK